MCCLGELPWSDLWDDGLCRWQQPRSVLSIVDISVFTWRVNIPIKIYQAENAEFQQIIKLLENVFEWFMKLLKYHHINVNRKFMIYSKRGLKGITMFAKFKVQIFCYRLFHLVITIGFQFLVMRDIEKLTGCIRLAIIYLGSGVAGNLASSIFLPYHVEVC